MTKLNKIQIRSKILRTLEILKSEKNVSMDKFLEITKDLSEIKDNDTVFDILSKELEKESNENYCSYIRAFLIQLTNINYLSDKILKILEDKTKSDTLKYKLLETLKILGKDLPYNDFYHYFENAEKIISEDTEKLLVSAEVNPETQIDFLDFLSSLKPEDADMLVDSLATDSTGDSLSNILNPVLFADFNIKIKNKVAEILGDTGSALGISGLNYAVETSDDRSLKAICQKSLKKLKLAGKKAEDAKDFYSEIIKNSKPYLCFSGIPDGGFNVGTLFSRKRDDGSIMMFAAVYNNSYGVVDCFGFSILSEEEFQKIATGFAKSESHFLITPQYAKYLAFKAFEKTKELKLPVKYEFICWLPLTADVNILGFTPEQALKHIIKPVEITDKIYDFLFEDDLFDKWFFTEADNAEFTEIIKEINSSDYISIDLLENIVTDNFDKIWKKETVDLFEKNITDLAYLLLMNGKNLLAAYVYSILNDKKYKKIFCEEIIKRSIYGYFAKIRQNSLKYETESNVFKLNRNKKANQPDNKTVERILAEIEENWVNEPNTGA